MGQQKSSGVPQLGVNPPVGELELPHDPTHAWEVKSGTPGKKEKHIYPPKLESCLQIAMIFLLRRIAKIKIAWGGVGKGSCTSWLSMIMSEDGFKPNRDLLNVNFEGYKLSESPLGVVHRELPSVVSTVTLKDEFSYQHVRAHTLHNHLHFDPHSPTSVYWCSKDGSVLRGSYSEENNAVSIRTVYHYGKTH